MCCFCTCTLYQHYHVASWCICHLIFFCVETVKTLGPQFSNLYHLFLLLPSWTHNANRIRLHRFIYSHNVKSYLLKVDSFFFWSYFRFQTSSGHQHCYWTGRFQKALPLTFVSYDSQHQHAPTQPHKTLN